jgi:hypothetical protein
VKTVFVRLNFEDVVCKLLDMFCFCVTLFEMFEKKLPKTCIQTVCSFTSTAKESVFVGVKPQKLHIISGILHLAPVYNLWYQYVKEQLKFLLSGDFNIKLRSALLVELLEIYDGRRRCA